MTTEIGQAPAQHTSGRRWTRRLGILLPVLLVFGMLSTIAAPSAFAARAWCKTDPIVLIDGELADILVSSSLLAPLKVTGPTQIVVTVPEGVSTLLVLADLGFGRGQVVTFQQSPELKVTDAGIQVQIAVFVPSRDNKLPVAVEFAPRLLGLLAPERAEGFANRWVYLNVVF